MTVWVVLYCDRFGEFDVNAVFETRELANEFCERYGFPKTLIEEHRLWDSVPCVGPDGQWSASHSPSERPLDLEQIAKVFGIPSQLLGDS